MGIFSSLGSFFGIGKKNVNILIVGLDNSGKTTLINRLKPEIKQSPTVVPTVGYLVEKFNYQNFQIQAYDMAGQAKYRDNWETFLPGVHGIIFVVDSSDKLRMPVARDEIFGLLDKMEVLNRSVCF
uniref:ADP-ribosylation factor-like protein 6 n=1 Tax=Rhabditophanes sp. KR3021 TaxID=114890 RepID=A0AC35UFY0_9BILA